MKLAAAAGYPKQVWEVPELRSVHDNPVGDVPIRVWSPTAAKMLAIKAMA